MSQFANLNVKTTTKIKSTQLGKYFKLTRRGGRFALPSQKDFGNPRNPFVSCVPSACTDHYGESHLPVGRPKSSSLGKAGTVLLSVWTQSSNSETLKTGIATVVVGKRFNTFRYIKPTGTRCSDIIVNLQVIACRASFWISFADSTYQHNQKNEDHLCRCCSGHRSGCSQLCSISKWVKAEESYSVFSVARTLVNKSTN